VNHLAAPARRIGLGGELLMIALSRSQAEALCSLHFPLGRLLNSVLLLDCRALIRVPTLSKLHCGLDRREPSDAGLQGVKELKKSGPQQ